MPTSKASPQVFNITEAARWVVIVMDDLALDGSHRVAAMGVWRNLVGLPETEALAYARELDANPTRPVRAMVPPL